MKIPGGAAAAAFLLVVAAGTSTRITAAAPVTLEVWTSPRDDWDASTGEANGPNVLLMDALLQVTLALREEIVLDMNQVLHDGCPKVNMDGDTLLSASERNDLCQVNCVNGVKYCEYPPVDGLHSLTTGKELLGETVRRICAWQLTPSDDPSLFLDYMFHFHQAKCDQHNFGRSCLTQVYQLSEIQEQDIIDCAKSGGGFNGQDNTLLQATIAKQRDRGFTEPGTIFPMLLVNNQPLPQEAINDPNDLLEAICNSLPEDEQPENCQLMGTLVSAFAPPDPATVLADATLHLQQDLALAAGTTYKEVANTSIIEIWTTPLMDWNSEEEGNGPNKEIFQRFQKIQYDFKDNIILRPRNFVYTPAQVCPDLEQAQLGLIDPTEANECVHDSCSNLQRYCAIGNNINANMTGYAMLEESLRRACIWELKPKEFFDYWLFFHKYQCDNVTTTDHDQCILEVLEKTQIDPEAVADCMDKTGGLDEDAENMLLQGVLALQNATFPYLELDYQELPIVLMDGVPLEDTSTLTLYQTICGNMQRAEGQPKLKLCKENLPEYVATFDVTLKTLLAREQQFEDDLANFLELKAPKIKPDNHVPIVEVWTTPMLDWKSDTDSSDGPNIDLFDKMRELVIGFGNKILFRPQYYLYTSEEVCGVDVDTDVLKECQDTDCSNRGQYCAFGSSKEHLNGNKIMGETLRRTCLWEFIGRNADPEDDIQYFGYLTEYHANKCLDKTMDCIDDVFHSQSINSGQLWPCTVGSGDTRSGSKKNDVLAAMRAVQEGKFFYNQLDPANLPIVLINGIPVEEGTDLSLDELFDMVCAEFPEDALPDICIGDMDENLGEDFNITVTPSILEELEGDAYGKEGFDNLTFAEATAAPTTGAPLLEAVVATVAPTTEAPEKVVATVPPTTEAPLLTDAPTRVTSSPTETPLESTLPATVATEAAIAATTLPAETYATTEPALPSATAEPVVSVTTAPLEPPAAATQAALPTETVPPPMAETGYPVATQAAVNIAAETASPQTPSWGLNGAGETPPAVSQRTSGGITSAPERPADDIQTATLDLEAPPLSEVESLEELDMTLVTSAIDHMEALQKCDVDTKMLIKKLMALGAGGDALKQEWADIEKDLPLFMSENCPHEEGQEIMDRMAEFQKCSMFNLQELIETFPSTAMGVAMRCANAYSKMTPAEAEQGFVPEACIRTIESNGVLGRAIFGLYLYPDVSCPCFEKLGHHIPECTADVWPIPINGVLVKTQSCLVGQYCQAIDGLCTNNLEILNQCLPSEDVKGRDIPCGKVFDACSDIYDNVPPLLNAAPLPDACVRIAEGSQYYGQHIVDRYNTFRRECGQNLELWEGHTPVAEFKAFVTDGINGINLYGFDFLSGASGGFLMGIAFCIVFVIVRNICRCICNCLSRCCSCCGKKKKNPRPRTKDYDTVDTNGEDVPEYRD